MQKTGQVDRTQDADFAEEEAKFRTLEKEVVALQKEAKAYLDAIRGAYSLLAHAARPG